MDSAPSRNKERASAGGVYVHVPFCRTKCPYCAFFSRVHPSEDLVARYMDGIRADLARFRALPGGGAFRPSSLYVGGGTPASLSPSALDSLLSLLEKSILLDNVSEYTVEANPGTLSRGILDILRAHGANRLSLGVQSFDDGVLRALGRSHTAREAVDAMRLARAAGFSNLSVDLMFGGTPESAARLARDVARAAAEGAAHLSAYALEFEEGTAFWRKREIETPAWETRQAVAYRALRRAAAAAGFRHYEISNFARPGRESRHNALYWSGGDYWGLGPGAHSHWRGVRFSSSRTLPSWREDFREELPLRATARETFVMGLRRLAGWREADFAAATGFTPAALYGETLSSAVRAGKLVRRNGRVRLSRRWLFLSDAVFRDFV
ncbi:MAG: radical SAM family heme chaperone HemW [Kiritimatiellae bacterium]|nr:radical SAM family heme chaperone HemW [Kiritimatiellia bacterium]